MDAMLGGMTWEEEYNLLTKFHESNLGPAEKKDVHSEGETNKKSGLAPVGGEKARSLGRGSEMSTHDESFIVDQRGNFLSTALRDSLLVTKAKAENVSSRKTSRKNK